MGQSSRKLSVTCCAAFGLGHPTPRRRAEGMEGTVVLVQTLRSERQHAICCNLGSFCWSCVQLVCLVFLGGDKAEMRIRVDKRKLATLTICNTPQNREVLASEEDSCLINSHSANPEIPNLPRPSCHQATVDPRSPDLPRAPAEERRTSGTGTTASCGARSSTSSSLPGTPVPLRVGSSR